MLKKVNPRKIAAIGLLLLFAGGLIRCLNVHVNDFFPGFITGMGLVFICYGYMKMIQSRQHK
jgi:hypothetical protein